MNTLQLPKTFLQSPSDIYVKNYTSYFPLNADCVQFVLLLDIIRSPFEPNETLKGFLGNSFCFDLQLDNDSLVGSFSPRHFAANETVRFELHSSARSAPYSFRLIRGESLVGPAVTSLAVNFYTHGDDKRTPSNLGRDKRQCSGGNRCHDNFRLRGCSLHEIESLAAWSLIRMMQCREAPSQKGMQHRPYFTQSTGNRLRDAEVEPVVLPPGISALAAQEPQSYADLRAHLDRVRRKAHGLPAADKGIVKSNDTPNNDALGGILEQTRGVIPPALKVGLFMTCHSSGRRIIEKYHRQILKLEPFDTVSANFFCMNRPDDSVYTIMSLELREDPLAPEQTRGRMVAALDRFEVEKTRLSDLRRWQPVDSWPPRKNKTAALFDPTNGYHKVPFASVLRPQSAIACSPPADGIGIAEAVFVHIESWPQQLRSAQFRSTDELYSVSFVVGSVDFHCVAGVTKALLDFLFIDWLPAVPEAQKPAI